MYQKTLSIIYFFWIIFQANGSNLKPFLPLERKMSLGFLPAFIPSLFQPYSLLTSSWPTLFPHTYLDPLQIQCLSQISFHCFSLRNGTLFRNYGAGTICRIYWVGQRVHSSFSLKWYRKLRTNFLANPTVAADLETTLWDPLYYRSLGLICQMSSYTRDPQCSSQHAGEEP